MSENGLLSAGGNFSQHGRKATCCVALYSLQVELLRDLNSEWNNGKRLDRGINYGKVRSRGGEVPPGSVVSGMLSHAMPATWISGNLIKFQKAWTVSWLSSAEPPSSTWWCGGG